MRVSRGPVLVIACGALAGELVSLKRLNDWNSLDIQCLPAGLHNRPERIPDTVEEKIRSNLGRYKKILIAYADCGTGGLLDKVVERYGASRIPGAHCYEFFSGARQFEAMNDREPGTFYLTDYLARNFGRLIIKGMGIDRHPELKPMLFGNYRKLVYLAQTENRELEQAARAAAACLELEYQRVDTGLDPFNSCLKSQIET